VFPPESSADHNMQFSSHLGCDEYFGIGRVSIEASHI
jgi:hypothetical protein